MQLAEAGFIGASAGFPVNYNILTSEIASSICHNINFIIITGMHRFPCMPVRCLLILDNDISCFNWAMDTDDRNHFDICRITWPRNKINT